MRTLPVVAKDQKMAETKSRGIRVLRVCKPSVSPVAAILAITTLGVGGCASNNATAGASGAGGKEGMSLAGSGGRAGTAAAGAASGIAGSTPSGAGGGGGAAGLGSGGTAASGAANGGGAGSGGGAAGLGGAPNAGAGGTQGGGGGSGGKGSWVEAFNHKDLTNFHSLIHGWKYDDNHYNTFRVDPTTGYLVNSLADYPGGAKGYGGHCGLLYYDQNLTDYALRIEYHFLPSGDGNSNGGMEVFCDDPSKVQGDPMYAPGIELQVIAQCTNGCGGGTTKAGDGSNNLSVCTGVFPLTADIMGNPAAGTTNCTPGSYAKLPTRDQWVTVECEIHPGGASKCWDCWEDAPTPQTPFPGCLPDTTQRPDIIFSNVRQKNGGAIVKGGFFAPIQSEGQEQEYRSTQVKDLSP